MNYHEITRLKDIVKFKEEQFNKEILLKNDNNMFIIAALKKEQFLGTHKSDTDAIIYILDGEVKFDFYDEDNKDLILKTGDAMKFKKDEKHSVIAKKDSKFIVIRI